MNLTAIINFLLPILFSLTGHDSQEISDLLIGEGNGDGYVRSPQFKVVCYYRSWISYKKPALQIEEIPVDKCTHIIYAYAFIDPSTSDIKPFDEYLDINLKAYTRFTDLKMKNPSLKVLLGIGGSAMSMGSWQQMASKKRKSDFASKAVQFLEKYNFDGLDIVWVDPGDKSKGGKSRDKQGILDLVKELSDKFKPSGLMLTLTTSGKKSKLEVGYDKEIFQYVDQVHIKTYDLHNHLDGAVDVPSPLYRREIDDGNNLNVEDGAQALVDIGCPKHKILISIGAFARSFTLASLGQTDLKSPSIGAGTVGDDAEPSGVLTYKDVCERLKNQWRKGFDPEGVVPYIFNGNQWVAYEDAASISLKREFIIEKGYGGAMIWSIDLDDHKGVCSKHKFPLLTSLIG